MRYIFRQCVQPFTASGVRQSERIKRRVLRHAVGQRNQPQAARNATNVVLEILHFVKDRGVIQNFLIFWIMRIERAIQMYRTPRPRAENPDDLICRSKRVTGNTTAPAFAGKTLPDDGIRPKLRQVNACTTIENSFAKLNACFLGTCKRQACGADN